MIPDQYNSRTLDLQSGEHLTEDEFSISFESIDRQLATLRVVNETIGDGVDGDPADDYRYRPSDVVTHMHRAPRGVGNTNRLASVLTETQSGANNYTAGLELFIGFFIITPFVLWVILLLALKLKYEFCKKPKVTAGWKAFKTIAQIPTPKTVISDDENPKTPTTPTTTKDKDQKATTLISTTSWVAGGEVINLIELSKAGVSRKERKKLILRSWRLQSTFLSVSILIPVLSVVLMERGWKPLEMAIREIQELNEDVETLAYRGWSAVDGLESSKEKLFADNELVQSILAYSYANAEEPERKPTKNKQINRARQRNDNNRRRRAQTSQKWLATSTPTSDFDFFFDDLLSDIATSSPTDKFESPWHDEESYVPNRPQQPGVNVENKNKNDNKSSAEKFLSNKNTNANKETSSTSIDPSSSTAVSTTKVPEHGIFIEDWCPDAVRFIGAEELNYWTDSINNLTEKTQAIHHIFNSLEDSFPSMESASNSKEADESSSSHASSAFRFVTDTTNYVNEAIEWFFANDWLLKLLVMILNVVNGLLLANVYFISKNDFIHQPTRLYVAYVLVPLFVAAAISVVIVTVLAGTAVLINSDFCSGGSGIGGPQGTIEDVILTLQQQQKDNGLVPDDTLNLVYDAVDYYWTGCLTENPIQFLEDFSDDMDDTAARVNEFTMLFSFIDTTPTANSMVVQPEQTGQASSTMSTPKTTLATLNKACQRDMSFLPSAIQDLKTQVDQIRTNIHKLSDTMSCGQVSPLLRRVSHGAVCVESPQSLTVLWGSSFGIAILCFIVLTVRAALYNSVKYKKKRKKKPRRIVEKEFEEYKEFMGKYYGETITREWKIDGIPLPPTKLELEFDMDIELQGTFDTAKSGKDSDDCSQNEEGSDNAGIFIRKIEEDESSCGSSYDSECSDDEKSIDSDDDQGSAIGSLLSETKSIALKTLHSLRNVKSLLSSSTKKSTLPQHIGSNISDEEDLEDYDNRFFFSNKLEDVSDTGGDDKDGGRILDNGDSKSIANSISDDSLFLPTPKNVIPTPTATSENKKSLALSKDDSFSDEDGLDDAEDGILAGHSRAMEKHTWTPNNPISTMSPTAPRKPLSYLARTLYTSKGREDCTEEEMNSLVLPTKLANLKSFRSRNPQEGTIRLDQTMKSRRKKLEP